MMIPRAAGSGKDKIIGGHDMDNKIMTLRLRREQRRMTQAELGAALGVSQSVVSEWWKWWEK